ncbi:MAG: hypothetical protein LBJ11_08715 [Oscillospiraceae bacterium]|jgi:triacylglycerol lipase|nr:hypothetical protein [Oscillospiraceae bacterium]
MPNDTLPSDRCATKYPILLVHGAGFRDRTRLNYWGRIPKALARGGARVYYAGQDAWGTAERNAEVICRRAREVLAETGAEKLHLIAHSKGGLDARYAVSALGLGEHTATLTTISTPHHGSRAMDLLCRLPNVLLRFAAVFVNLACRLLGDKQPDFYHAATHLTTAACRRFQETVPDHPGVICQSYACAMKGPLSDIFFWFPYLAVKLLEGDNDGLVSVRSSQWGNFRGTIAGPGRRGISHGDAVDLRRISVRGADIRDVYVRIVAELKDLGM